MKGAEYEEALKEYQAALTKRPESGGVSNAIGNVYWTTKQYEQAEQWLTEELKRNPYHGLVHYRLGSIYVEQGNADAAIAHLEQALQSHPNLTGSAIRPGKGVRGNGPHPGTSRNDGVRNRREQPRADAVNRPT